MKETRNTKLDMRTSARVKKLATKLAKAEGKSRSRYIEDLIESDNLRRSVKMS